MRHNNIASERVRIGESVEDVARVAGVTVSSVRKWESGEMAPSGERLVLMARHFGCTPDYLLDMTEERTGTTPPRTPMT